MNQVYCLIVDLQYRLFCVSTPQLLLWTMWDLRLETSDLDFWLDKFLIPHAMNSASWVGGDGPFWFYCQPKSFELGLGFGLLGWQYCLHVDRNTIKDLLWLFYKLNNLSYFSRDQHHQWLSNWVCTHICNSQTVVLQHQACYTWKHNPHFSCRFDNNMLHRREGYYYRNIQHHKVWRCIGLGLEV